MRRPFLFLIAALWLFPALVHAAEKDLIVGVEDLEYYPMYAWRDGEWVGAGREILDAFAKDRGYRLSYRPLPVKRLFAELVAGTIDLKYPDNPTWAADTKKGSAVTYSKPVVSYIDGVMVRPGNLGATPVTIKTLGTVAGFTPYAWLDQINSGKVALKENPRMELLLKQAVVGHVDGAYANVAVATHLLDKGMNIPNALVFDPRLPHSKDSYALSSTRHPEIIAEFNVWMTENEARIRTIKDTLGAERGMN